MQSAYSFTHIGPYVVQQQLEGDHLYTSYQVVTPNTQQKSTLTLFPIVERLPKQARARFLSRFTQEVSLQLPLDHPSISSVKEYGEHMGYPYFVVPTSYTRGETLANVLNYGERRTITKILTILRGLCQALSYAHQRNIIHGNLSPANIFLEANQSPIITNFGLGRILEQYGTFGQNYATGSHTLNVTGTPIGKLDYIASECLDGKIVDLPAELYSVASILYELWTGAAPVHLRSASYSRLAQRQKRPSIKQFHPELSEAMVLHLDLFFQQALHADPNKRFASANTLLLAYEQITQNV